MTGAATMSGGQAHRDVLVQVLAGAYVAAMIEGDPQWAAELIAPVLHGLDPVTAPAEPVLIELAVLWTYCMTEGGDVPIEALRWARYSVAAATARHSGGHRTTYRARLSLAGALRGRGEHLDAAEAYRLAVDDLRELGEHEQALRLRAVRAAALHAGGRCQAGISELTAVRRAHPDNGRDGGAGGGPSTDQLVGMFVACGRFQEARELVAHTTSGSSPQMTRQALTAGCIAAVPAVDEGHVLVCERRRHIPLDARLRPAASLPRHNWKDLLS